MKIESALYLESCIFILKPLPKNRLRQLRVRNDSCEIHPAFQVLIALMCEQSQQLLLSNRSREKYNRKEYLHQWQMIQASIKACYSDYSSIDVGSHKKLFGFESVQPYELTWTCQWMNEKSQEDKNPFGPGYQIYTSPDAWRYQSGRVWALFLHCIRILSLFFRKLKESISGASWKHILEEEASKIFTRMSCPLFRLSGERIIPATRPCASLRAADLGSVGQDTFSAGTFGGFPGLASCLRRSVQPGQWTLTLI